MHTWLTRRPVRPTALLIVLCALFALSAQPLFAHGYVVRAIPADREALDRAPARVQYWFSEPLEPDFSTLTVRDLDGNTVAQGGVSPRHDTLLEARLPADLPDGTYFNELRIAFASDGHVIVERRPFFIGAAGTAGSTGASTTALPLEVVWRFLVSTGHALLLGVTALYPFVLVPAWGNPDHRAGQVPPRVLARLTGIAAGALALVGVGAILSLLDQSALFFGADLGRVVGDRLWEVVRTSTRFGDTWTWRMVITAGVAALVAAAWFWRARYPAFVRGFWAAAAWGSALALATLSLSSHAAGSNLLPWAAIINDWLHRVGVALWVGGAAALALVVPVALGPLAADARRAAFLAALRRFSPIAAGALGVVIASGLYSASNWVTRPDDAATPYGLALLAKAVLIVPLIVLGAVHHVLAHPARYPRWNAWAARIGAGGHALGIEAAAALLVVGAAGLLGATPVPTPPLAAGPPPPSASAVLGDLTVTTTLTPGGPGVNAYDVQVTRAGVPADDVTATLRMIDPSRDVRALAVVLEPVGGGALIGAGAEIDRAGEWRSVVVLRDANGASLGQVAYTWPISEAAAVASTRAPGVVHGVLLFGVVLMAWLAVRPAARRAVRSLDLHPTTLTVAAGAAAACVAVVIIGVQLTEASARDYDAAVNPPPSVVNTVLPTADSVARGAGLLAEACPGWWADARPSGPLARVIERLSRTRDEALYALVEHGGAGLNPCLTDSAEARWDIVNALRTWESDL
jgi:putative copper export protein/methionine-rich copper-binding protein CopC